MVKVLDFRGVKCPEPVVKTVDEVARSRVGDELVVYSDSEECVKAIVEALEGIADVKVVDRVGYKEVRIVVKEARRPEEVSC